jgi:hypothetical protein
MTSSTEVIARRKGSPLSPPFNIHPKDVYLDAYDVVDEHGNLLSDDVIQTIKELQAAPVCNSAPYVSGVGTVGEILNCTMGEWTGQPTSYSYQWKSDGVTDLGTGSNYTVLSADSGHSITCIVTATNEIGSTVSPPSNAVQASAGPSK